MTQPHSDMKSSFSLIPFQQSCIDEILALPEQGRRSMAYGFTLLNRKARGLNRIRKNHEKVLSRRGYTDAQICISWGDIRDMAKLEASA